MHFSNTDAASTMASSIYSRQIVGQLLTLYFQLLTFKIKLNTPHNLHLNMGNKQLVCQKMSFHSLNQLM